MEVIWLAGLILCGHILKSFRCLPLAGMSRQRGVRSAGPREIGPAAETRRIWTPGSGQGFLFLDVTPGDNSSQTRRRAEER